MFDCDHENEITDHHEGTIICIKCGLVKDSYYLQPVMDMKNNNTDSTVDTIIDKCQLPDFYSNQISHKLKCIKKRGKKTNVTSLKTVVSLIYKNVNTNLPILPLKTLMNISRLKPKQIKSNKIHFLDVDNLIEKHAKSFL